MTPTARSLAKLRKEGFLACVVERWIPGANIRRDMFGFADIVAIKPGCGIFAVQVTSMTNKASRLAKVTSSEEAARWLESGGRILVHGWRKKKLKRGGKAVRWECSETEVDHEDCSDHTHG